MQLQRREVFRLESSVGAVAIEVAKFIANETDKSGKVVKFAGLTPG